MYFSKKLSLLELPFSGPVDQTLGVRTSFVDILFSFGLSESFFVISENRSEENIIFLIILKSLVLILYYLSFKTNFFGYLSKNCSFPRRKLTYFFIQL